MTLFIVSLYVVLVTLILGKANMMNIEISQLQTIISVADSGSFSKAAQDLSVTQSAISQSVKNVETKLGLSLFKRSGKTVLLTNEGKKLYEFGKSYIGELSRLNDEIQFSRDQMVGKLVIGTLTGVGKSWLSRKVIEFAEKYPEVEVKLSLDYQEDLVRSYENNEIDCMVVPDINLMQSGEKVFIGEEVVTLVVPDRPEFEVTENSSFEDIIKYPIILFEENDTLFTKWCYSVFKKRVGKLNKRLVINSHGNMLEAVSKGLGIAVLPTHVIARNPYRDDIKDFGKRFHVKSQDFFFVYQKEQEDILRMQKFKESLVESLQNDPLNL